MKVKTTKQRTTYSFDGGIDIAVVTRRWPEWRVKIFVPPLPVRSFTNRKAADQHAAYFAQRACAQAAGYSVHRTESGRYVFTKPDGTAGEQPPQVTESGAWFAAYSDSIGSK